jgi:hypothetical protein
MHVDSHANTGHGGIGQRWMAQEFVVAGPSPAVDAAAASRTSVILLAELPDGRTRSCRFSADRLADDPRPAVQVLRGWLQGRAAGFRQLALIQHFTDGRCTTIVWSAPAPTDAHLAAALAHRPTILADPGCRKTDRRWAWGPVSVVAGKEVGPPPRPWPRLYAAAGRWRATVKTGWRLTTYTAAVELAPEDLSSRRRLTMARAVDELRRRLRGPAASMLQERWGRRP